MINYADFDIIADTAGFGGQTIHCPVWIIATVQPQLHTGVDVMWRHFHNIMKNTTVFDKTWWGGAGKISLFPF